MSLKSRVPQESLRPTQRLALVRLIRPYILMRFCLLDAGLGRVLPSDSASEATHKNIVTVTVYAFLPTFPCVFLRCDRVNL